MSSSSSVPDPARAALPAGDPARCPQCGGPNACVPAASSRFDRRCWCEDVTIDAAALARVPAAAVHRACLCAACACGEPRAAVQTGAGA